MAGAARVHREPLPGVAHEGDERIALFRLEGAMFFGASDRILSEVTAITHGEPRLREPVDVVILWLSHLQLVDATGARALADLVLELEQRDVTVLVKGIQPQHRRLLEAVGLNRMLAHESHLFTDLPSAVEHARSHVPAPLTA